MLSLIAKSDLKIVVSKQLISITDQQKITFYYKSAYGVSLIG